ncbi:MAG: DNA ligase [Chthoniobacterales bacterium]|nr:DNA ligase [Chthoniobacterales bacterium]
MRHPPWWRVTVLGLAAGVIMLCAAAAKGEDVPAANPSAEKQSPGLLLANVWNPSIDPSGWWMSEKYDGLRGYWDGRKLWSRKGKPIHAPDYFLAELPQDVALDGELWIGRGKFEETISIVLSETPDDRWKRVHFMVFDAPQAEGTFEKRMQFLQGTLSRENRFAKVVVQERCLGMEQLLAERDRVVGLGGEGLMLRQPESRYEARRSPTLLKVKPYDDAEATVVGYEAGRGKFAGELGSLHVRTADGKAFSIGTGFTDVQRKSPPPVGTVITYRFRGLTAKGLPRFPSYLRVRRD